jgi:hypothetical protein
MMHYATRLLIALPVMLAASSSAGVGQIPDRSKLSPVLTPTTPLLDPRQPLPAPAVVQPGTVLTVASASLAPAGRRSP